MTSSFPKGFGASPVVSNFTIRLARLNPLYISIHPINSPKIRLNAALPVENIGAINAIPAKINSVSAPVAISSISYSSVALTSSTFPSMAIRTAVRVPPQLRQNFCSVLFWAPQRGQNIHGLLEPLAHIGLGPTSGLVSELRANLTMRIFGEAISSRITKHGQDKFGRAKSLT